MIKKQGIWYSVKYFFVVQFAAAAVLLLLVWQPLTRAVCNRFQILSGGVLHNAITYGILLLMIAGWALTAAFVWRRRIYRYMTGRNLFYDHLVYRRPCWQLIDYFKDAEPNRLDTSVFPVLPWENAHGIVFGMDEERLIMIPSDSEGNIAVFGPPGSGKTAGLVIINAMTFAGSVLAVDIKGDIYFYVSTHSNRKIIRFCPDDPNALSESCRFNPLAGIDGMSITEKKLYVESMSSILIPDEGGNDGNYFTNRARKLFQGITHMILHDDPTASFPDIVHAILTGNVFQWVNDAVASDCEEAKELLSSFIGSNEKNVSGAYDALASALIYFSNPILDELLSNKKDSINIQTLDDGYDLYLQISQEHLDQYAPLFTLLIEAFSASFSKRPDKSTRAINRPILMILDEFPQLTFPYSIINRNLATLRSKAVVCMIVQQNLSQLEYRYQTVGARSIIGNCNYQVILGSNDINSSKVFSDMFGEKKVLTRSNSDPRSANQNHGYMTSEKKEPVFPAADFGSLEHAIVYFRGKYCECAKINAYEGGDTDAG